MPDSVSVSQVSEASGGNMTGMVSLSSEQLQQLIQAAITGALASTQSTRTTTTDTTPGIKQIDRPTMDLECNESRWAFFLNEWKLYKRRTNLSPSAATAELRACCSENLRMELFDFIGPNIDTLEEEALIKHMQELAVKGKNVAVHRQEFYSIQQSPGQPIQQFVAKLRAKAEHCNFRLECSKAGCKTNNSYATEMITDQMVVGLYDKDIQGEVLAKHATSKGFQAKYDLIQALEEGKRAKEQLSTESNVTSQRSSYRRKQTPQRTTSDEQSTDTGCPGCGSTDHGPGTNKPRVKHCPARRKVCQHCSIPGHIQEVCRKRSAVTTQAPQPTVTAPLVSINNASETAEPPSWFFTCTSSEDQKDATFITHLRKKNRHAWKSRGHNGVAHTSVPDRIMVPHMEWSSAKESFVPQRPRPLPKLSVRISIIKDAHKHFRRPIIDEKCTRIQSNTVDAYADSGAQTCACGTETLHSLGMDESDLIPTSHRIVGVTSTAMDLAGVFLARLSAGGSCTRQVIYVSRNTKGFFLSETALRDLGSLSPSFPVPLPDSTVMAAAGLQSKDHHLAPCGCLRRTKPPPRPDTIPFDPVDANVSTLENWILKYYASSAFNVCEHQPLPCMTGSALEVHFKPDSKPVAYHSPIPVPHHWKTKVKADLDRDVRLGIIEPVPPGTPTLWCSRMVVVPKKDGSPRRTVDLQPLNAATYRITHHTPSPFNQASIVPPHTRKTVIDAWNGYHSLQLSPAARDATTFITEWGRYRYLRAPQGFHAAGDGYTRCFDDITVDVLRKTKCIDDTILWDDDITKSFWHTIDYVALCAENGVVFNPKKFQFARKEVEFAGFSITETGIKPSKSLLDAILNFPTPANITDARSWFGLVNQVAYNISSSSMMQPFRELLKPGHWYWSDTLDKAFEESRAAIIQIVEKGVRSFEPNRPTCLATDWSKRGLGFTLLQKACRCPMDDAPNCCRGGWQLIFAGSRFTTDAESRYAPIEGEALAVTYGLEKSRMFTLGCSDLLIATDHKPLVKILGDSALNTITNPRLFSLKEKTLPYRYTIKHVPGTWHSAPDACSRQPSKSLTEALTSSMQSECDDSDYTSFLTTHGYVESHIRAATSALYMDDCLQAITLERVKQAAQSDPECIALTRLILHGFPDDDSSVEGIARPYWKLRDDLSSVDGIILYAGRIVIPTSLRKEVLECLHSAHQGVVGMKARAQSTVYWPGLSNAIATRRAQCKTCNSIAPSQPAEPLQPSPAPSYPFEMTVADYFVLKGITYLVYADRYTGWVTVARCSTHGMDATSLQRELRTLFSMYGAPAELSTDGGQPFASHSTQQFLRTWGVRWRLSSAYYAQSNGRAELAVKTAKRILSDNTGPKGDLNTDRLARALMQYRNTPIQNLGVSPAQMLYGRTLRDHLPSFADALRIRHEWKRLAEDRERALAKKHLLQIERYNEHTKSLPQLSAGDYVAVQNQTGSHPNRWDKTGCITEVNDHGQYTVRLDGSGRCTLRNRRFLRQIQPVCADRPLVTQPLSDQMPATRPETTPSSLPNNDHGGDISADTPEPQNPIVPEISSSSPPTVTTQPEPTQEAPSSNHQGPVALRRSTRIRKPPLELSMCFRGKRHDVNCRSAPT